MTPLVFRRGQNAPAPPNAGPAHRIGHVYLDVRRRLLHFLNEAARQMQREGVPFTPADLARQPLQHPDGTEVAPNQLPLLLSWRSKRPVEAVFVVPREGGFCQNIAWNAANGWILVQTVWLSVITIAIGRLRDKWPAENTLARLDEVLQAPAQPLTMTDGWWCAAAIVAAIVTRVA